MTYRMTDLPGSWMVAFLVAGGLVACGGEDDGGGTVVTPSLKDQTLQGQRKGNEWSRTAGRAHISGGDIDMEFYSGPEDDCSFDTSTYTNEWRLRIRRFPEEKTRQDLINPISSDRDGPVLLYTKGEGSNSRNIIITNGFVEITSITETTVKGSVVGEATDTSVNGHFEATRCSEQNGTGGSRSESDDEASNNSSG